MAAQTGLLSIFLQTLGFILISVVPALLNLRRAYRGRQFLLPIIALVFCLPCMLLTGELVDFFIQLIPSFANLVSRIPGIGNGIASLLSDWYYSLLSGSGIQLYGNFIIVLLFFILKLILLLILRRSWKESRPVYERTSGFFYSVKANGEGAALRRKYRDMRNMFRALYITSLILGTAVCLFALLSNNYWVLITPLHPVFASIILGEIFFFLNGSLPDSDEEVEKEVPVRACDEILESLESMFADRLGYSDHKYLPVPVEAVTPWEERLAGGDRLSHVTLAYFRSLQRDGHEIEPDYTIATNRLMHHQSVLIHNPFYHDMTDYVILPMLHELLNDHTCLVVCGRTTNKVDLIEWLKEGILKVSDLPKLWRVENLQTVGDPNQTPDIGIIGFEQIFDLATIQINRQFFEKTSFVIFVEPSNLMGTGQVGLRSLLQICEKENKEITYCMLDRNADGLVDALSHLIRKSIIEVVASPMAKSDYCRAFWRAEGPGMQERIFTSISHYMGIGGEISSHAMHEGCGPVHWYSGSKMPLLDLRWNIEQYYPAICQYIEIPMAQSELDERLHFHESLWQAAFGKRTFVITEDEFCNAFEMERMFGAKIRDKGFVNVLSESYMLRDFMYGNQKLFTNDPKAIPSIVPDYARTERNFVLRTLLLMSMLPMEESVLSKELTLHGHEGVQPYHEFAALVKKHTGVDNPRIQTVMNTAQIGVTSNTRFSYKIDKEFLDQLFHSALRMAFYVVEDEKTETHIMGNRLMDHIEQVILPGQFFCYEGKYYQVRSISAKNGIIVRRSGDHLYGRRYYRQLRNYTLYEAEPVEDAKIIRGSCLAKMRSDISVDTDAYLEMAARNDLPNADIVELSAQSHRKLLKKEFLQVSMKDTSPEVRFTISVLLNELFQTIYPNDCDYLTVVVPELPEAVKKQDAESRKKIHSLAPVCSVSDDHDESFYIIEDSTLDLGLLISVERNYQRLMEILAEYLEWYLNSDRKRKGAAEYAHTPYKVKMPMLISGKKRVRMDDRIGDDIGGEDEELLDRRKTNKNPYHYFEYLTYGYGNVPEWLSLRETLEYLKKNRFLDSNLHRAMHEARGFDDGSDYDPDLPGVHYCDFCGAVLKPGEYDVLKDGRERCPECSKEAVKTVREFRVIAQETITEMERIFEIEIPDNVRIRMSSARRVNEDNADYRPSPRFDARILGYAKGNSILVESGAPRWKMKATLVHELTHVWQWKNWESDYFGRYGSDATVTEATEGMAVWTEIQYLMSMEQQDRAIRYKRNRDTDSSHYGTGMKKYLDKYPPKDIRKVPKRKSPFGHFPPL